MKRSNSKMEPHTGSKRSKQSDNKAEMNNSTQEMFQGYRNELDTRHDKHERIVKLSRDITIASKRTIFLLHRYSGSESDNNVLEEALEKIQGVQKDKFIHIAQELENEDPYTFLRAYTAGLQEYIEALSFYHYLKSKRLVSLEEVKRDLCFCVDAKSECSEAGERRKKTHSELIETSVSKLSEGEIKTDCKTNQTVDKLSAECDDLANKASQRSVTVHIPPMEYMLGLADLTGELMRLAINSVGAGNLNTPLQVCKFLRQMERGFSSFGNASREMNRKITTLRRSLQKVEAVCYTIQVRGSEIPKHMLVDMLSKNSEDHSVFPDEHSAVDD